MPRSLTKGQRREYRQGVLFVLPFMLLFLVFVLLYVPCVAAVSTIRKEMNSLKWTLASVAWQIGAAYLGSFLVYQIGGLILGV